MKGALYLLTHIALIFLIITTFCLKDIHSQNVLNKEVIINLIDASPTDVVKFLSRNYNIYTGVETIMYDGDEAGKKLLPINIKCAKCSISDVLNQLITIDNRYIWSYTDNIIDVLPKDPGDRIVDTYIKDIQIKQKDIDEIRKHLFEIPEVVEAINKRSLHPLIFMSSGILGAKSDEVEKVWLSQTNTTLIKVLNEIIKKEGTKNWTIHKTKKEFRVITLTL